MSDEDMYDDEEFEFEYTDEDDEEQDVDVENQYYGAKGSLDSNAEEALRGFNEVIRMQGEPCEWGFKALKHIVRIHFRKKQYEELRKRYAEMLSYIQSAVTRNYSEKTINKILDEVSTADNVDLLQALYTMTLQALKEARNERLWFKTNLKLCKLWFDAEEYNRMQKILRELHKSCTTEDGSDDPRKGTQLLEIYALEIQMYTMLRDTKKLKQLYNRALAIQSAIPHPRIMGVIRECGGKMNMREREWQKAHTDFFEAFKNYDEAGHPRRIQSLKYLVLANMLMQSDINPFDSQEAKPYKNHPEIVVMTNLVQSYMSNDISQFEKIIRDNNDLIMNDSFVRNYIEDLLRNIRTQTLKEIIQPYTRIRLSSLAQKVNISVDEVEELLVLLILDKEIDGRIDQVGGLFYADNTSGSSARFQAVLDWTESTQKMADDLLARLR